MVLCACINMYTTNKKLPKIQLFWMIHDIWSVELTRWNKMIITRKNAFRVIFKSILVIFRMIPTSFIILRLEYIDFYIYTLFIDLINIFHNRSLNSAAFCAIQWMSFKKPFPSIQLKHLILFSIQGPQPIVIKVRLWLQTLIIFFLNQVKLPREIQLLNLKICKI